MRSLRPSREQRGFTLIEVMVAMMVLIVGVLGTVTLIDGANATTVVTKDREGATNLVREVIESARTLDYDSLTSYAPDGSSPVVTALSALPSLTDADASSAGWQLRRRGILYTVDVSACKYDDPKDGSGPHAVAAEYCNTVPAGATADTNSPDDYRRLAVKASWSWRGATRGVSQIAIVANPSGGLGPPISNFDVTSPAGLSDPVSIGPTTPAFPTIPPKLGFTAKSPTADSLNWFVDDGATQGTLTGGAPNWTFDWNLGTVGAFSCTSTPDWVLDGTYLVTAQALDSRGIPGPSQTKTITINRSAPAPPCGLDGGLDPRTDGNVVDLQWRPNAERDIARYEVYRQRIDSSETNDRLVCTVLGDTACVDDVLPPKATAGYYVRAFDTAGNHTDSQPITVSLDPSANQPPSAPAGLTAAIVNGQPTLSWSASSDPDGSVQFYRVYRDGTAIANRYDVTGTTSYVDAPGGSHSYWVTAVDNDFRESPAAGPVTP